MNRSMWPVMGLLLVLTAGDRYSMHRAFGKMLQPHRGHARMMAHLWGVQQRPSYYCGESAIAKRLIKAGHRIDMPDVEGYTPVEYALAGENNELPILLGEWQAFQDSLLSL